MYTKQYIDTAVHWWSAENKPDSEVRALISFLFESLDALYFAVSRFPEYWSCDTRLGLKSGGIHGMHLKMGLPPDKMILLRSAISLSGDIYCILKRLAKLKTRGLKSSIDGLILEIERFRALRNFFAHFDERISDLDRHGISGEHNTSCGITYTDSAKGCFHMVLIGNVFHFSSNGVPEEIDIGKISFLRVLHLSKPIYKQLTSHNIHRNTVNYPGPRNIYA